MNKLNLDTLKIIALKIKSLDKDKIKNIIIISVALLCLFFGYKWYNKDTNKGLLDKLKSENKSIQNDRKNIQKQIDSMSIDYNKLSKERIILEKKLSIDDEIILNSKNELLKSKNELSNLKYEKNKLTQEIKKLRENPANREGDDLLISLKRHLNERSKKYK